MRKPRDRRMQETAETGAPQQRAAPLPDGLERWGALAQGVSLPDEMVLEPDGGFWVFAYGSLMWNPGFPFAERRAAMLDGYRRSFCLWSIHYRGTPQRPGLVLGLAEDPEARTRGVAYRVAPDAAPEARRVIAERELVSAAYFETVAPATLLCETTAVATGESRALAYVVDPSHTQYAGRLSLEEQTAVIDESVGPSGRNCEYLFNTVAHLRAAGLSNDEIGELAALEAAILARRKR